MPAGVVSGQCYIDLDFSGVLCRTTRIKAPVENAIGIASPFSCPGNDKVAVGVHRHGRVSLLTSCSGIDQLIGGVQGSAVGIEAPVEDAFAIARAIAGPDNDKVSGIVHGNCRLTLVTGGGKIGAELNAIGCSIGVIQLRIDTG